MRRVAWTLAAIVLVVAAVVVATWLRDPGPPPRTPPPARAENGTEPASDRSPTPEPSRVPSPTQLEPTPTPERRPQEAWPRHYGRVVSADARSPLAEAWIGAARRVPLSGNRDAEGLALNELDEIATCDADGRFAIPPEQPATILVVMATGFGSVLCDRAWLGDAADAPLEIALAREATLAGTMLDPAGAPLAGVDVDLIAFASLATASRERDDSRLLDEVVVLRARSDERGRVVFDALPARVPFQAHLARDGRLRLVDEAPIQLAAGEAATREWRVPVGATVSGRAVDSDGRVLPDLELTLLEIAVLRTAPTRSTPTVTQRAVPRTDGKGRFAISDVDPGSWLLRSVLQYSTPEQDGLLPSAVRFDVAAGAKEVEVELLVRRGPSIRGRVLAPDGTRARATLAVQSLASGPLPYLASTADAEGRFALGPFEGGSYEVVAEPLDPRFARSEPRVAEPGKDDVVLRLRAAASVRPRAVRKEDGEPVRAQFTLHAEDDPGRLALTSLPPGRYDLVAIGDDGSIGFERAIELREGVDRDVTVSMVPGAKLVLRGTRAAGDREPFRLLAGPFCFASGDVDGATRLELVVPAAPIRLAHSGGPDPSALDLDLPAGTTREVDWPPTSK